MTLLIFAGDMLVMAFMIALVAWVGLGMSDSDVETASRLPLEDDSEHRDG